MQKRPKKLDVLLYGYVYIFLYILTPKNTVYRLHTLCIRARALYGLKMCKYRALNVSFLGLLTLSSYVHIPTCVLLYRGNKITWTAIDIAPLLNGQPLKSGQFSKS